MYKKSISLFLLFVSSFLLAVEEKPLVIITASYNNAEWYKKNLDSIFEQQYSNWRLIYIDDCSTDGTAALVDEYVAHYQQAQRVTILHNEQWRGHLYNQYSAIHSCKPDEIILIVDGDDWLAHDLVFAKINEIYSSQDTWITYGQFWYWKKNKLGFCKPLSLAVLASGLIRQKPWLTSHLRTFYAGLYQRIRYDDLQYKGAFYPMCADVATMLPMIEMAGIHVSFIPEIMYIYNDANSLNIFSSHQEEQRRIEKEIRTKEHYTPLEIPPYFKELI